MGNVDRRDDPTIFSYNLMNEPRSQQELYVVRRKTTDSGKIYNISYNPADDLQNWIKDTAAYIKSMDPVHLLTTGPPALPHALHCVTAVSEVQKLAA